MDTTRDQARGQWRNILSLLGIEQKYLRGKHCPCPICGGKDRYRFTDYKREGGYICNQCGAGDGFVLLMKFHGWDFATAAKAVDGVIGRRTRLDQNEHTPEEERTHKAAKAFFATHPHISGGQWEPPKSLADTTLWLRRYHPEQLPEWLAKQDPMLTLWLDRTRSD